MMAEVSYISDPGLTLPHCNVNIFFDVYSNMYNAITP